MGGTHIDSAVSAGRSVCGYWGKHTDVYIGEGGGGGGPMGGKGGAIITELEAGPVGMTEAGTIGGLLLVGLRVEFVKPENETGAVDGPEWLIGGRRRALVEPEGMLIRSCSALAIIRRFLFCCSNSMSCIW